MILVLLAAAASQAAETPRQFVERLYASYHRSDFSPFAHPERIFAPRLLAAINDDSRLAHGEVGYLDGDPLCQCQDAGGLRASVKSVARTGNKRATAYVTLDYPDSSLTRVRLSLVLTHGAWRIADVAAPDEPSLLNALERSNRRARARH